MDVRMAGMDGLEAIRLLKKDPATGKIPVISLTAFASSSDVERCHAAGAVDYVSKPIDFEDLGRKMRQHLKQGAPA
jgi:two-component system cell cycle response regulator DivK